MKKNFFDEKLIKFVIVGIINTLVGTTIMFSMYNLLGFSYWVSSATNYILTSILSFFLNKNFTFKYEGNTLKAAVRFFVNIAVCYLLAYGIAKPLTKVCMSGFDTVIQVNAAMMVGMVMFVAFNYTGQRFFAFKEKK